MWLHSLFSTKTSNNLICWRVQNVENPWKIDSDPMFLGIRIEARSDGLALAVCDSIMQAKEHVKIK